MQSPQLQKGILVALIVLIFLSVSILPKSWIEVKSLFYVSLRKISLKVLTFQTKKMESLEGKKFILKYFKEDSNSADMVLSVTEEVWLPVTEYLLFEPKGKFQVLMYPNTEQMNQTFGWDADKSAMGVYWLGTIRVLAPDQWIETNDEQQKEKIFRAYGPMTHEFTHLVIDYKTNGNYSRWFTEGVAQFVEMKTTGFTLDTPEEAEMLNLYEFSQLSREYDSQDQIMAYWQSLKAIEYIVDTFGKEQLNVITDKLAAGKTMNEALVETIDLDEDGLKSALIPYIMEVYSINQ